MRRILFATVLLLGCFVPRPAAAEIFIDDFDRPDGPLGPPWELLDQSPLYIENEQLVARTNEYGLMLYGELCPDCYCDTAALLSSFNFSSDISYNGRFQFFIGGGEAESDYWGFIAKLGLDEVSLERFDNVTGETELIAMASPLEHDFGYAIAMSYDPVAQTISLLVAGAVEYVVNWTIPAPSGPFCYCAIGIENLDDVGDEGTIDDVRFQYCCDITDVTEVGPAAVLRAWPRPFATSVEFRAPSSLATTRVDIYDVAGRRVGMIRLADGFGRWEANGLPAGLYLAKVVGRENRMANDAPLKLVKLR